MKRRTPIEQAIAESTDRRARYEKSMRDQGFKKTSFWVPLDCVEDVRQLAKLLGSTNGRYRSALRRLVRSELPSGGGE